MTEQGERLRLLFDEAIQRLKDCEPKEGYYVAFSGGKDSIVAFDLVKRSGVRFDAHFQKTSVDPPELLEYIRINYPEVEWEYPKDTMFQLIVKNKMLPGRRARFCCRILKEGKGHNRLVVTGVRSGESFARSKRSMFEIAFDDKTKKYLHLILDWTETDIWSYIRGLNMPYCKLYDEGFTRVGCLGCPMASKKVMEMQFERYPNVRLAYKNSVQKALNIKPSKHFGTDAELQMLWWISKQSIEKFKLSSTYHNYLCDPGDGYLRSEVTL